MHVRRLGIDSVRLCVYCGIHCREGFALLSGVFPSQSPGALRTLLQQRQPPGSGRAGEAGKQLYTVSTAVQDLAASDLFR
jgi:hypothetical protein